ncbi:MAG TPA: PQQ-binding-like beta-propeller repeat protein [Longimicrobiales bacterium]|nr:PQQ-binding-like beta-propeller repeat protein [Longimicrobiales bacterium]
MPIPADLASWPTVLESARRDAWLDESAPERPIREWTIDLGRGVTAPLAIASDLLFATTIDRRLIVLAASTGSFFWERRLPGAAPAGAVFDPTTVYVAGQEHDGAAEAYELARGFLVWRRELPPPIGAPLLHDGVTYWGTETGRVYALGALDGVQRWRADLAGGVVATPVVDRDDLLIATSADTLYRVEMRTGRAVAGLPLPSTVTATPAFDGRRLHLPMHDTTHVVVDVDEWRIARVDSLDAPARAAPLLDRDGSVFLLTDHATVWRIPSVGPAQRVTELGGAARASLALASNGLLVGRLDGALFFLRRDGTVVWREDFDDSLEAPVAVYRGAVYVPLLRGELVKLRQEGGS